jgi:hypothetical protein
MLKDRIIEAYSRLDTRKQLAGSYWATVLFDDERKRLQRLYSILLHRYKVFNPVL